ncbi:MAG: helix-turn-helix domain-containing protein [Candidatus Levybacteria bacterium]|nr:helix-turn-helix domain-containing protein [Candidatus Levybacteria bacterium]
MPSCEVRPRLEDLPDVLQVGEVAQILGLSRNAVYLAISRGEIPSIRVGKRVLIPKARLQEMLNGAE